MRRWVGALAAVGLLATLSLGAFWLAKETETAVQKEVDAALSAANVGGHAEVAGRDVLLTVNSDESQRAVEVVDAVPGVRVVHLAEQPSTDEETTASPSSEVSPADPTATPTESEDSSTEPTQQASQDPAGSPGDGELPEFPTILFEGASAELPESATAQVEQVAAMLRERENVRVQVVGHTDNGLTPDERLTLGWQRANAVSKALQDRGVQADRIATDSRADREPVADNATAEGQAKNRRVEITAVSEDE